MNKSFLLVILVCVLVSCNAQRSIRGVVLSATSKNPVGFANVVVKHGGEIVTGTNSDENGRFKLQIDNDFKNLNIHISKIGYASQDTTIAFGIKSGEEVILWLGGVDASKLLFDGETARKDLDQGIVQIYDFGIPAINSDKMNQIATRYGFKYEFLTCEINEVVTESVKRYNKVVEEYLSEINPKGWKDSLDKEIRHIKSK